MLLSLPVGLTGVCVFAKIFGIDNNIYLQILVIMFIGLLSQNVTLIVESAAERRLEGLSIADAALERARVRLRLILMTPFAFIFGLMPPLFASGAGAIGGMLFSTLLGVFIIPVAHMIFEGLQERINGGPKDRLEQMQREEADAPLVAPVAAKTPEPVAG